MSETKKERTRIFNVKVILPMLVAAVFVAWLLLTPRGFWGKLDAVGYSICHQQEERSFIFFGHKMPLCARCSGMYVGAAVGFIYLFIKKRRAQLPPKKVMLGLGLLAGLFALDGINSLLSSLPIHFVLYEPANWLRLLSGAAFGISFPLILLPLFHQTAWSSAIQEPGVENVQQLSLILALSLAVSAAILMNNGVINSLLSIVSILSVVLILTLAYTLLWIIFLKKEMRFTRFSQTWIWFIAGLGTALVQIGIFDALRYLVTGTWTA